MYNLLKYRKLGFSILISMVILFFLSMATLWSFLLANEIEHKGWFVFLLTLLFICGILMFIVFFLVTDKKKFEAYVNSVLEKEKKLMLAQEEEEKKKEKEEEEAETKNRVDLKEVEEIANQIISGLNPKNQGELGSQLIEQVSKQLNFVQGIVYIKEKKSKKYVPSGSFAITGQEVDPFVIGEGIAGQAAEDKKPIRINDIPENYFDVSSGLGNSKPKHLMFIPIVYKNQTIALIEAGSFEKPDEKTELVLDKISIEAGKLVYKFLNN